MKVLKAIPFLILLFVCVPVQAMLVTIDFEEVTPVSFQWNLRVIPLKL